MSDDFDALLKGFKGSQVTSLVRYRAGGQAGSNWGYAGATGRAAFGAMIQVGSSDWTGAAATSGSLEIALPAVYAGSPVAIATPVLTVPAFEDVRLLLAADTYQITVYWFSTNNLTEVWFHWLTVGMPATG